MKYHLRHCHECVGVCMGVYVWVYVWVCMCGCMYGCVWVCMCVCVCVCVSVDSQLTYRCKGQISAGRLKVHTSVLTHFPEYSNHAHKISGPLYSQSDYTHWINRASTLRD